jgi:hypothetical protein
VDVSPRATSTHPVVLHGAAGRGAATAAAAIDAIASALRSTSYSVRRDSRRGKEAVESAP